MWEIANCKCRKCGHLFLEVLNLADPPPVAFRQTVSIQVKGKHVRKRVSTFYQMCDRCYCGLGGREALDRHLAWRNATMERNGLSMTIEE